MPLCADVNVKSNATEQAVIASAPKLAKKDARATSAPELETVTPAQRRVIVPANELEEKIAAILTAELPSSPIMGHLTKHLFGSFKRYHTDSAKPEAKRERFERINLEVELFAMQGHVLGWRIRLHFYRADGVLYHKSNLFFTSPSEALSEALAGNKEKADELFLFAGKVRSRRTRGRHSSARSS